jgi:hypothetical protein
MGDQRVARPLLTQDKQTQNKRIKTSLPIAGFEPTIPVVKRAKTFHALDRAATVTGTELSYIFIIQIAQFRTQSCCLCKYVKATTA